MSEYLDSATIYVDLAPSGTEERTITDAATVTVTLLPAGEDQFVKFLPTLEAHLKERWRTSMETRWLSTEPEKRWDIPYFGKGSSADS